MTYTLQLDASGRLVLPKALRDRLNLSGGANLRAEVVAGHIELTPAASAQQPVIVRKSGIAVLKRTGIKVDAAKAVIAERTALEQRAQRQ